MMMKKYLVTGGSGFLGSDLVRRLVKAGHDVRVLDDNSRGALRRLADIDREYEFIEGDIRDAGIVARAARGVDSVIHLAFINGTEFFYSRPDLVLDVAVKGMINVLDSCIAAKVAELIVASSSEVYQEPPHVPTAEDVPLSIPDPHNPRYSYAGGKIISELMALNNGKHFERLLIFRPHNVYGPDMGWEHVIPQFVMRMRQSIAEYPSGMIPFPIQGDGSQKRSFIFIEDFTDGLLRVLEKGQHRGIYHVGTSEEVPISHLANVVASCFSRSIDILPSAEALGGTRRRCPDISKLQSLGFSPRTSLEEGVRRTTAWYVANASLSPQKNYSFA